MRHGEYELRRNSNPHRILFRYLHVFLRIKHHYHQKNHYFNSQQL